MEVYKVDGEHVACEHATINATNFSFFKTFSMSRRQCSIWGCSNRKGRCPEDTEGKRHCSCPEIRGQGCPESSKLVTLHNVGKMPKKVLRIVNRMISTTRKSSKGGSWKLGTESYV
jgi:hypothetical protein